MGVRLQEIPFFVKFKIDVRNKCNKFFDWVLGHFLLLLLTENP